MFLPQGIKHLQHYRLLKVPHDLRTGLLLLRIVRLDQLIENALTKRLFVELFIAFQPTWNIEACTKLLFQTINQAVHIPLLFHTLGRNVLIDHTADHVFADRLDCLGDVALRHQFIALLIDHFTLIIGDIIVFEQILANIEVVSFHLALGIFDRS